VFVHCSAKVETLPFESKLNIISLALSPNGNLLIAVNEGEPFVTWQYKEEKFSFNSTFLSVIDVFFKQLVSFSLCGLICRQFTHVEYISGISLFTYYLLCFWVDGDATMVNMVSRAMLPLYKFHSPVHAISFSPDSK
jgi:hypothetical protein